MLALLHSIFAACDKHISHTHDVERLICPQSYSDSLSLTQPHHHSRPAVSPQFAHHSHTYRPTPCRQALESFGQCRRPFPPNPPIPLPGTPTPPPSPTPSNYTPPQTPLPPTHPCLLCHASKLASQRASGGGAGRASLGIAAFHFFLGKSGMPSVHFSMFQPPTVPLFNF